jgi:hypothetical protein
MIMHMAVLTRRLQVLLDEERFSRLEAHAQRRGTTVAALVRDALDRAYPPGQLSTQEAVARLLARPPRDLGTWDDAKQETIFGQECRSLIWEARGDLGKAIEHRQNFAGIRDLHRRSAFVTIAGDHPAAEPFGGNGEFAAELTGAQEHECRDKHRMAIAARLFLG